jgi:predicted DNA-binding transcriptional regulator AlpA
MAFLPIAFACYQVSIAQPIAPEVNVQTQSKPFLDPDQLMTETQVADFLCQSIRTIQKWWITGFGPAFYKIGRSVRYKRGELVDWMNERKRAHTSATGAPVN